MPQIMKVAGITVRLAGELIAYMREERLDRPVLVGHSLGAFLAFSVASTVPDAVGPIVAVEGVPFMPALTNPSATVDAVKTQAEQMRALYQSMTPQQIGMQSRMALTQMITDPANVSRATGWTAQSDGRATGQAIYELVARVPHHQVVTATQALHFVMWDDAPFLHATMNAFLERTVRRAEGR